MMEEIFLFFLDEEKNQSWGIKDPIEKKKDFYKLKTQQNNSCTFAVPVIK
jgi:hypothetical protein